MSLMYHNAFFHMSQYASFSALKKCEIMFLGVAFPALKESDAMFLSEKAPDWLDGECCHRCRIQFGLVQRKVISCFLLMMHLFPITPFHSLQ